MTPPPVILGDSSGWSRRQPCRDLPAHQATGGRCELFYWRDRNREVDFVVRAGRALVAIEVKSGRRRDTLPGMAAFTAAFDPTRTLLVGADGIELEEFLLRPVEHWIGG